MIKILHVLKEWLPFVADICVFGITIYTFYLTFLTKKIRFLSFGQEISAIEGVKLSIVLENRCLSSIAISTVDLIIDDKYSINIANCFSDPITIEPLKSCKITSQPITDSEIPDEYLLKIISAKKFEASVRLYSGETIETHKNIWEKISRYFISKLGIKKNRQKINLIRKHIDNIFISSYVKYLLKIHEKHNIINILILDSGRCSQKYQNLDVVPENIVNNYDKTKVFIKKHLHFRQKFDLIDVKNK